MKLTERRTARFTYDMFIIMSRSVALTSIFSVWGKSSAKMWVRRTRGLKELDKLIVAPPVST